MRNEVCTLIVSYPAYGKIAEIEKDVFCSRKSAVRSEFYAAYAVGLKPRFVLQLDPMDWKAILDLLPKDLPEDVKEIAPNKVRYCGSVYNIYRDYQTDESTIEITVG